MYNARIVTDSGQTFNFGYEYGSVFDIDPLTGVDVDLATSQGYQQIGETVEGQSVGGINRTIKGVFFKNAATQTAEMLSKLPIFTTGKLYYNNDYFCEIVVKKTPVIYTNKVGVTNFSMLVFCPNPFWLAKTEQSYRMVGARVHNYINSGIAQMEFKVEFRTSSSVEQPGIMNEDNGKYLKLNTLLTYAAPLTIYRRQGRLYVLKNDTEDMFSTLDEGSNLFEIVSGNNNLIATAKNFANSLLTTVSFYEPYMGVINATD